MAIDFTKYKGICEGAKKMGKKTLMIALTMGICIYGGADSKFKSDGLGICRCRSPEPAED